MKSAFTVSYFCVIVANAVSHNVKPAETNEEPRPALRILRTRPLAQLERRPQAALAAARTQVVPPSKLATVKHDKDAGQGYNKGSPLYAKQEQLKTSPDAALDTKEKKEKECWCEQGSWSEKWLPKSICCEDPDEVTYKSIVWDHLLEHCITAVVEIVVILLCAYCYKTMKANGYMQYRGEREPKTGWAYSFFSCEDCREDLPLCCMSLCCPVIRAADTISNGKVSLLSFWPAVLILVLLVALGVLTAGISVLVLTCFMIYSRQRIRRAFAHSDGTCYSWCFDAAAWCCCCWCCAMVQEAREVEKVRRPALTTKL